MHMKMIKRLGILTVLILPLLSFSRNNGQDSRDVTPICDTIQPLPQEFLTNLTLSNWNKIVTLLPQVNPEKPDYKEVFELMQHDYGVVGGVMTPVAITVKSTTFYSLSGSEFDNPLQIYLSATGGSVTISVIGRTDSGRDYIKSIKITGGSAGSSSDKDDFELQKDENGSYILTLSPNKTNGFRVVTLITESVGWYEDYPGRPYRNSEFYQIVQFPWSDDEALTTDPVIRNCRRKVKD